MTSLIAQAAPDDRFGTIAIVVLIVYMIVLLGLGVVGYLRSRGTEEDFYLAGRGQGFLVTVMTIMATFFSSAAILGIPGEVYRHGMAFTLFAMNLPVAGACVYLLGAKIRRIGQRRKYVTQGDMLADYYGDSLGVRSVVALAGFFYAVLYIVMQIKAGGLLAQMMFPAGDPVKFLGFELDTFELGTIALSIVTMVYVLIGGMRSVAWTDVMQGMLLFGGMVLAAVATMVSLGGFTGFFEKVAELPPEALSLPGPEGKYNATTLLTICIFSSIASIIQPAQWMRLYAARNDRTLKRSSLIFAVVLPVCFLFGIMLVALAGRAIYPPVEMIDGTLNAHAQLGGGTAFDQIVVVMIKEQLPAMLGFAGVILVAIILVAILAASMSTADSNLHALSAVLVRDVYDRFLRPKSSDKERAWVGRLIIVAATLFALWLVNAIQVSDEANPLKMIANIMFAAIAAACQLLPATIDMLFIRKGTRIGMICGVISGLCVVFLFTPFAVSLAGWIGGEKLAGWLERDTGFLQSLFDIGFCGFAVNVAIFAVVSCFTKKLDRSRVEAAARDMEA